MRRYSYVLSLILCIAMVLSGCKEKPVAAKYDNINTAIGYFNKGLDYDKAGQMRLAELFYKRAYEMILDEPSQDWNLYGESGYRYACMLYQLCLYALSAWRHGRCAGRRQRSVG